MFGALLLLGLVIAVVKNASTGVWLEVENPPIDVRSFVAEQLGTADADDIEEAADEAEKQGATETAEVLRKRADMLRALPDAPFPEPNALGWKKFVSILATPPTDRVSADGRYGAFGFTVKRLADLKLVTNVKPGKYNGRNVYTGTWVPPLTGQAFLVDFKLQYATFVRSCTEYRSRYLSLKNKRPEVIGNAVNGKALTLSGWLALCHRAGLASAIRWVTEPANRFAKTTAFVVRANGIF